MNVFHKKKLPQVGEKQLTQKNVSSIAVFKGDVNTQIFAAREFQPVQEISYFYLFMNTVFMRNVINFMHNYCGDAAHLQRSRKLYIQRGRVRCQAHNHEINLKHIYFVVQRIDLMIDDNEVQKWILNSIVIPKTSKKQQQQLEILDQDCDYTLCNYNRLVNYNASQGQSCCICPLFVEDPNEYKMYHIDCQKTSKQAVPADELCMTKMFSWVVFRDQDLEVSFVRKTFGRKCQNCGERNLNGHQTLAHANCPVDNPHQWNLMLGGVDQVTLDYVDTIDCDLAFQRNPQAQGHGQVQQNQNNNQGGPDNNNQGGNPNNQNNNQGGPDNSNQGQNNQSNRGGFNLQAILGSLTTSKNNKTKSVCQTNSIQFQALTSDIVSKKPLKLVLDSRIEKKVSGKSGLSKEKFEIIYAKNMPKPKKNQQADFQVSKGFKTKDVQSQSFLSKQPCSKSPSSIEKQDNISQKKPVPFKATDVSNRRSQDLNSDFSKPKKLLHVEKNQKDLSTSPFRKNYCLKKKSIERNNKESLQ